MRHWVLLKNGRYVSDIDEHGKPLYTYDKGEAKKIYNFNVAMFYFQLGYCLLKEYC